MNNRSAHGVEQFPVTMETVTGNETGQLVVAEGCLMLRLSSEVPWNNPHNLISVEVEEWFDTIVCVVFLNLLYLISAPANIINLMVFTRQGLKERIYLCLFCQSLFDLLYMTTNFLYYVERPFHLITGSSRLGHVQAFMLTKNLIGFYGFFWVSAFVTTVIACEKCFCVVSPLRSQRVLTTQTMLAVIAVAFVILLGVSFFVTSRWSVACVFSPLTNSTFNQILPSRFYLRHKELVDKTEAYLFGIIMPWVMMITTLVTTVVTIVKLKEMISWRENTSSGKMKAAELNLTRTLVGCSIFFIVCNVPMGMFKILILAVPDFNLGKRYHNTFNLMLNVTELFSYFNSSFNFFIYYSMGSKYRETLHALCGMRGKTKKTKNNSMENQVSETVCTMAE